MRNASGEKLSMQRGAPEAAFTRLVHDQLTGQRGQFVDNVVAVFASHQQSAHGTLIANCHAVMTSGSTDLAQSFRCCEIRQLGSMAFARVDDVEAHRA